MGRGRGKGKKQSVIAARDDTVSGDEEKLPVRRRGRPLKSMKDDIDEEEEVEVKKMEEENYEGNKKRKKPTPMKEGDDLVTEENGIVAEANSTALIKNVSYRPNGSRRKSKPRRAAEVGVECR